MNEIQIIKVLRRLESCLYDDNIDTSGWTANDYFDVMNDSAADDVPPFNSYSSEELFDIAVIYDIHKKLSK